MARIWHVLASDSFQVPSISTQVCGAGAAVPRGVAMATSAVDVSPATVGSDTSKVIAP